MYIQPMSYEKFKTVREKSADRFDTQINDFLKKGWVIISVGQSELQSSDFGSSRDMYHVAYLGKKRTTSYEVK